MRIRCASAAKSSYGVFELMDGVFELMDGKRDLQGDYKKKIKKPMDLGTIKAKLEENKYADLEQSAGRDPCSTVGFRNQDHYIDPLPTCDAPALSI